MDIIELMKNGKYIGISRIDGYPIYKYQVGDNPRTKGLDTKIFKYNKRGDIIQIITPI